MDNLQNIINLTKENQEGYELQVELEDFSKETLINYINNNKDTFNKISNAKLGTWVNNNIVYIDITRIYTNKKVAIREAVKYNQLAIFDLKKLEEITIKQINKKAI